MNLSRSACSLKLGICSVRGAAEKPTEVHESNQLVVNRQVLQKDRELVQEAVS
jgi:hypothetical protein